MSKVVAFTGDHVPGPQILQEADITVERLRSLFETAMIDAEPDEEGDLYLKERARLPDLGAAR